MEARAEFELLLESLLDSEPDESRNRRLEAILLAHPEFQEDYLDYLQLHALLQWRAGLGAPQAEQSSAGEYASTKGNPSLYPQARWRRRTTLAAAVACMAASLAAVLIWQISSVHATSDLVDRLVTWNLDLTQARSRDERDRIYNAQAADLQETFAKMVMLHEDRELAETLLETSSWLVKNADPAAEAERFNDIADMFVAQIDGAAAAQDEQRVVQLATTYRRLAEVGIDANVERAHASGGLDAEKKRKLEQTTQRCAHRTLQLVEMIDRQPEPSRKAIRRAMKGNFHKSKKKGME